MLSNHKNPYSEWWPFVQGCELAPLHASQLDVVQAVSPHLSSHCPWSSPLIPLPPQHTCDPILTSESWHRHIFGPEASVRTQYFAIGCILWKWQWPSLLQSVCSVDTCISAQTRYIWLGRRPVNLWLACVQLAVWMASRSGRPGTLTPTCNWHVPR